MRRVVSSSAVALLAIPAPSAAGIARGAPIAAAAGIGVGELVADPDAQRGRRVVVTGVVSGVERA